MKQIESTCHAGDSVKCQHAAACTSEAENNPTCISTEFEIYRHHPPIETSTVCSSDHSHHPKFVTRTTLLTNSLSTRFPPHNFTFTTYGPSAAATTLHAPQTSSSQFYPPSHAVPHAEPGYKPRIVSTWTQSLSRADQEMSVTTSPKRHLAGISYEALSGTVSVGR